MKTDHKDKGNGTSLEILLRWFSELIRTRIQDSKIITASEVPHMPTEWYSDQLGKFIGENECDSVELAILSLVLAPTVDESYLEKLVLQGNPARLTQYKPTGTVRATIATVIFLLQTDSIDGRLQILDRFSTDHWFYKRSILHIESVPQGVSDLNRAISISPNYRDLFLRNRHIPPRFSESFPAHRIETSLGWDDLILNPSTEQRLLEIRNWMEKASILEKDAGIGKHFRKGYRCLFHGASGTGKTLAATLLGKYLDRPVYRVDLSAVISKYIGETSKNLDALFNTAEDKDWILFFDEGDALFGKRMSTNEADNKNVHFANQDIAYLLQRIEYFNGLVIVSTNFKKNFDDAFARRFNQMILFQPPNAANQIEFWTRYRPECVSYAPDVNLQHLTRNFQLTGASIINVLQRATVLALAEDKDALSTALLQRCIQDEQYK